MLISRTAKFEELEKIEDLKERREKIRALWNKEGSRKRLFVERNTDNDSGLFLFDANGKPKIKVIDENRNA